MTDLSRESDVQYELRTWLDATAWWTYSLAQGRATRQSAGLPDLLCLRPHTGILLLEAKARTGVQSAAQAKFEARCVAAGVPYVVARSVAELQGYLRLKGIIA
jgi:hypothetical protein